MSYQNIVFDLYGTLVDVHTDENQEELWKTMSWFYRLHQADYSPEKLRRGYTQIIEKKESQLKKKTDRNSHPEVDLMLVFKELYEKENVFCDEYLAEDTALMFRAASMKRLRLYEGVEDLLSALKEAGKNIYLLTNAQKVFTECELRYLGIEDCFDGILYSSEAGVKKPDSRFYELLVRSYGLERKKTVMIGNDPFCDVKGALNAGISAIYLESNIIGSGKCPCFVKSFSISQVGLLKNELIQKDEI